MHRSNVEEISSMLSHEFSTKPITTEQHFIIPDKLGKGSIKRMKMKEGLELIRSLTWNFPKI